MIPSIESTWLHTLRPRSPYPLSGDQFLPSGVRRSLIMLSLVKLNRVTANHSLLSLGCDPSRSTSSRVPSNSVTSSSGPLSIALPTRAMGHPILSTTTPSTLATQSAVRQSSIPRSRLHLSRPMPSPAMPNPVTLNRDPWTLALRRILGGRGRLTTSTRSQQPWNQDPRNPKK